MVLVNIIGAEEEFASENIDRKNSKHQPYTEHNDNHFKAKSNQ
jgi:hypothetical protein